MTVDPVGSFDHSMIPPVDTSRPFLDVARAAFSTYQKETNGPASFGFFLDHDNFLWNRIVVELCPNGDLTRGYLDGLARKKGVPALRDKVTARTLCDIAAAYPELAYAARWQFDKLSDTGFTFPSVQHVPASMKHFQVAFGFDPEKVFVAASTMRERWPRVLFETTIYPTPDLWKGNRRLFRVSRVLAIETDNLEAVRKKMDSHGEYELGSLAVAVLDEKGENVGARLEVEREARFAARYGSEPHAPNNLQVLQINAVLTADSSAAMEYARQKVAKDQGRPDLANHYAATLQRVIQADFAASHREGIAERRESPFRKAFWQAIRGALIGIGIVVAIFLTASFIKVTP